MAVVRVKDKALRYAMLTAPTPTWRAGFNNAMHHIDNGTVCVYNDIRLVDSEAWRKAQHIWSHLPSGGRHVWNARHRFFSELCSALQVR